MKSVTVYIAHQVTPGEGGKVDDRPYVSSYEPSAERVALLRALGYEVFRAVVRLPVEDPSVPVEADVAEALP